MRVLIPYDGTINAENALLELYYVEFGRDDEILIVITDVFLAESFEEFSNVRRKRRLNFESSGNSSYAPARRGYEEELFLAKEIRDRLSFELPALNISVETLPGFNLVSSELLAKAARWKPDLIILGTQEDPTNEEDDGYNSGLWRVVSEAECEVRLIRERPTHARVIETVGSRRSPAYRAIVSELDKQKIPERQKLFAKNGKIKTFKATAPNYVNALPPEFYRETKAKVGGESKTVALAQ